MNEQEIADRLRANLPKPEVAAPVEKVVQEVAQEGVSKPTDLYNDLGAMRLLDFFAVSQELRNDRTTLDQLRYIQTWASEQAQSEDSVDIVRVLRQLEGQLGLTFRNDEKLSSIYRYIKLDNERRRIEKELANV